VTLEQTRQRYRFVVVGYVVMPEHIHLLLTEPEIGTPSTVMQVLNSARLVLCCRRKNGRTHVNGTYLRTWRHAARSGRRVSTISMYGRREAGLRYIHRNPVKRGLVESPEQWRWSSYRFYLSQEAGPVRVNEGWTEISFRDRAA
jgi:putative transposase